MGVIKAQYGR